MLIGTTERGTVVRLDRRFIEADLRIATGLVEPHFMAGWSGGRKVIAPGVAHAETITTFHSARFMEHPNCTNCVLEGNPLHEEQLAIMAMIGGARAVNSVIDDERRVAFLNYGEVVASHAAAVAFAEQYCTVPVAERFSTVLTSSAGYPLDATYYQTVKGMVGPLEILAPGGDLIVASACSERAGIGALRGRAAPAGRERPRSLPRRDQRQDPRGHRRVADRDAAPPHAGWHSPPLHRGPGAGRPRAYRSPDDRVDRGFGGGKRGPARRPACRRDPRRALSGARPPPGCITYFVSSPAPAAPLANGESGGTFPARGPARPIDSRGEYDGLARQTVAG